MKSEKRLKIAIEEVQTLDIHGLRERFAELFGAECVCPKSPQTIRDRIVYKLQEIHYGGICDADRKILEGLLTRRAARTIKKKINHKYLTIGVRLIRQWKGVNHEVVIQGEKAFEYDGKIFKSLSAIAKLITGTNWNGNAFFGVKNGARKNKSSLCGILPQVSGGRVGDGFQLPRRAKRSMRELHRKSEGERVGLSAATL